jgi:phage tail protein X
MPFKKAFDSVWRSTLFIKLQPVGIRGKLYNIIHDLYSNTLFACKDSTHHSNPFLANQGVKQGDSLSLLCLRFYG